MVETPATMYMDAATGPAGAFAVLAALHYRAATGRGQLIELAQIENAMSQLGDAFVDVQLGKDTPREGNRDPEQAPQGVYVCNAEESWLAITARNDTEWEALARVIGRDDLLVDTRFATVAGRYEHHDELDRAISEWTATQDVTTAFHTLQQSGVTAAPQFTEAMLADDPHVAARGWIRPMTSRDVGTYPHIGYAFQGRPPGVGPRRAGARRGQRLRVPQGPAARRRRVPALRRRQGDRRRLPRRRHEPGLKRAVLS